MISPRQPTKEKPAAGDVSPLVEGYKPPAGVFDELVDSAGGVRNSYTPLMASFAALGAAGLARRWEAGRRLIQEQGITFNTQGEGGGQSRQWQLDPVPLVISPADWAHLERGLVQRATLINLILADCYGAQNLLRQGRIPPGLLYAQPDFLRPCVGIKPAGGVFLNLYAADVGRSPDGRWWVLSDRTQIPTGAGYALENRIVTSRTLPEPFRAMNVRRLAGFFRVMQQSLAELSPRPGDQPRVAVLTPGPFNETYFEQAYLARYLGYSLVEGQDLVVRDERLWLRTLSGLEPVDVLLRRVDDDFCDPLELRNDSMLGIPGLTQALRAGTVGVANMLGTGILQSPAFMAFLPGLCREVLGEDLLIPSVATWWCGQESAQAHVLSRLDDLFVKPAFRPHSSRDRAPPPNALPRRELEERIRFQPHGFVAQERIELATAPGWVDGKLAPRRYALRVCLTATKGGYAAMPGGMGRVAAGEGYGLITMQRGGSTKDAWIPDNGPPEETTLLHDAGKPVELKRAGNNLPSRVADCFFWLGRYTERAESTLRLLRATLARCEPAGNSRMVAPGLEPLVRALVHQGIIPPGQWLDEGQQTAEAPRAQHLEEALIAAVFDPEKPSSLRSVLARVSGLALVMRDRLSTDTFRVARTLLEPISEMEKRLEESEALAATCALSALHRALPMLCALQGLAAENMTRTQAWRFLDMGVRVERSLFMAVLYWRGLQSRSADHPGMLEALLEVADNSITYRSRYNIIPNIAAVYDLLLMDTGSPRSIVSLLEAVEDHLAHLPRARDSALPDPARRLLMAATTRVRLLDPNELAQKPGGWSRSGVALALDSLRHELPAISDAIYSTYLAPTAVMRSRGG